MIDESDIAGYFALNLIELAETHRPAFQPRWTLDGVEEDDMAEIIIYMTTHRDACIYDVDDADLAVYHENIGRYWEWLEGQASRRGFTLTFEDEGAGRSSYTDDEGAEVWITNVATFWEWLQS